MGAERLYSTDTGRECWRIWDRAIFEAWINGET